MNSIKINNIEYFSAIEITKHIGISRQTLWRWRQHGKIPAGHRYRDRFLLYTIGEVDLIRRFADRLEQIEPIDTI